MSKARKKLDLATSKNLKKLKNKLRELFQLDRGDLDFGLYRVMAKKRKDVKRFLKHDLPPKVAEALKEIATADVAEWRAQLAEAEKGAKAAGIPREQSPEVTKYENKIAAAAKIDRRTEAETYDHLCNFFARYYDEGDFMSLRRYKSAGKEAYSIPYNGEEVKLHWANADQYYIKTADNYASYIFTLRGGAPRRVRFEIAAADAEKDNIKESKDKKRFFMLAKEFLSEDNGDLVIQFDHRPLRDGEQNPYLQNSDRKKIDQKIINRDIEQRITGKLSGGWLAVTDKASTKTDKERTLLGKHLTAYTAKNSFDYFIHKDLGGFLRRELDHYLKSEVVSMDNLELAGNASFIRTLAQAKAVKKVGDKIIDFLAQLEDFQKQLWLKKKFVLETSYCITLDKVPASLHADIVDNDAQRAEWKKLFAIEKVPGKSGAAAFCKENPYLVLDTRHFDCAFNDELLAGLSGQGGLDEQLDGLLVHGENFQALNLMQARYQEAVGSVYIDPPYNTAASEIIYKNGYKHSSWISLMSNRISSGKKLLRKDGFHIATIDYAEFYNLGIILDQIFGSESRVGIVTVFINPKGRQHERFFSSSTEYMIVHANDVSKAKFNQITVDAAKKEEFPLEDENGLYRLDEFVRIRSNTTRAKKPDAFYPIFVSPDLTELTSEHVEGYHEVLPTNNKGEEYSWKVQRETFKENNECGEYVAQYNDDNVLTIYNKFYEQQVFRNVWWEKKYFPEFHGHNLLKKILGDGSFSYPKSVHAVSDVLKISADNASVILDYFAGSGTTGHAVINLNREDGGARKYILVEVGHHFENVLLPRIKKVVYAKNWQGGKPRDRDGISQFVKCIRLESYEDALDSLCHKPRGDVVEAAKNREMLEDYQLRYALGEETAHSASLLGEDFIDPTAYKLSVVRDGIRHDETADLAETFNFLLGLRVSTRRVLENVLAITGIDGKGENCLVIWRNSRKMSASQLDKWFERHCADLRDGLNRIYVNGDQNLSALRGKGDRWGVEITELVFHQLMFEGGANG